MESFSLLVGNTSSNSKVGVTSGAVESASITISKNKNKKQRAKKANKDSIISECNNVKSNSIVDECTSGNSTDINELVVFKPYHDKLVPHTSTTKTDQISRSKKLYAKYFPCIETYLSDLDRICLKRNGYHNGVYKQREKLSKSPIRAGTDKIKGLNINRLTCSTSLARSFRDIALENLCESMKASVLDGGNIAVLFLSDISSCNALLVKKQNDFFSFEISSSASL